MLNVTKLLNFHPIQLAIDVGSFYTRIMLSQELIFNQPTCFLKDKATGSVLAVGSQAFDIWGKEPKQTKIIFPIKSGVIYDKKLFIEFLESVFKNTKKKTSNSIFNRVKIKLALPASASDLDKIFFRQSLSEIGLSEVSIVNRTEAVKSSLIFSASKQQTDNHKNSKIKTGFLFNDSTLDILLLDMGDQTTELGLITSGRPTISQTLRFGSRLLTTAIQDTLRQEQELAVSFHQANKLKHQLASLTAGESNIRASIRGIDVVDNLAVTRTISITELNPVVEKELEKLLYQLKKALSLIQPDYLINALENGLYLTGGGSLLSDLDRYLGKKMQVNVVRSEQPFLDVVRGTASLF